jgi:hypothetical protein
LNNEISSAILVSLHYSIFPVRLFDIQKRFSQYFCAMTIKTEPYTNYVQRLPKEGSHIVAYQEEEQMVVYQAYKPAIAKFAAANQYLGGDQFSYNRMSWIKPNFLWMMYRCGWARKENQESVLAIWIDKKDFDAILEQAVISSFNVQYYTTHDEWKRDLETKEVRLQWDPDHDPHGNKQQRRAIQLGLKGKSLESFGKNKIRRIEDVTAFVKEQWQFVQSNQLSQLQIPVETVYIPSDPALSGRIGISS